MKTILASEMDNFIENTNDDHDELFYLINDPDIEVIDDEDELENGNLIINDLFLQTNNILPATKDTYHGFCLTNNSSEHYCSLLYNLEVVQERFIITSSLQPYGIRKIIITDSITGEVLFEKRFNEYTKIEETDVGKAGSYIDWNVYRVITFCEDTGLNREPYSYTYYSNTIKKSDIKIPVELEIQY